jgi:Uncharacterized protein conserved in bacteria (DUF2059)
MSTERPTHFALRRTEILIAIIGLLGVLATALLSNWDKVFAGKETLVTSYEGYQPTGVFETEFRYFFEVSGTRAATEQMQEHMLSALRLKLLKEHPESASKTEEMLQAVRESAPSFDEVRERFLPIYRKHFSVDELQELNRFYSTEIMRKMIGKLPLLTQESAAIQMELMQELAKKLSVRLKSLSESDTDSQP